MFVLRTLKSARLLAETRLLNFCHITRKRFSTMDVKRTRVMDAEVPSCGTQYKVTLPGWEIDDFRFLRPGVQSFKPWIIFKKFENCREYGYAGGLVDKLNIDKTHLTYFKCIQFEKLVKQAEFQAMGYEPYSYDITVKTELVKVGRTSFQLEETLSHSERNIPLFKNQFIAVCVDKETLNAAPLPQWWVDKYRPLVENLDVVPLRISFHDQEPGRDSNICEILHTVRPSDVDYYHHMNNASYVMTCMDGVITALHRGLLVVNDQKNLEDAIEKIEVDFIADCKQDDELRVVTWTDDVNSAVIWSSIHKQDQVIFVQKITLALPAGKL